MRGLPLFIKWTVGEFIFVRLAEGKPCQMKELIVITALKCLVMSCIFVYLLAIRLELFSDIIIILSCPQDDQLYCNLKALEQGKYRINLWSNEQNENFLLLNCFFQEIVKAMKRGTNIERLHLNSSKQSACSTKMHRFISQNNSQPKNK